jgi:hypothetical protein
MPVVITMPHSVYLGFLGRCRLDSREYAALKTAVIERTPEERVEIMCDPADHARLVRHAKIFYSAALPYLETVNLTTGLSAAGAAPDLKTLGDILFSDKSKMRASEDDWLKCIRAIARGDEGALQSFYERTHQIVFTLILRITADRETAEEVTLDVFDDLSRNASAYDSATGSVVGWLMNQARSRAIDRRFDERKKQGDTYPHSLRPTMDIPQQFFLFEEQSRRLRNALGVDGLRPPEYLWSRLAKRIGRETATLPALSPSPAPATPEWEAVAPGIRVQILAHDSENDIVSMLVGLDPGTDYPGHSHGGIEELHLLQGILKVDDRTLYPGDFIHAEAGSVDHRVWSETGCTCFLMTSTKDELF